MDSNFSNPQINNHEEKLASGDAFCNQLILSPSLTDLLPNPDTELKKDNQNAEIWKYEEIPLERRQAEGKFSAPMFVPIGSLTKTKYQDDSKQQGETISVNSAKRENKFPDRNNKNPRGSHSNECFTPQEFQPELSFTNMVRLFLCQVCHMSPMTSMTVHMCKHGHQVCGNCFNHDNICAMCGELLDGRNRPVEAALHKMKQLRPELFFQQFLIPSDPDNMDEDRSESVHQPSHKPVQCPHLSCLSTVAYNGFLLHYKFEHSAVPIVNTTPESSHLFYLQESLLHHTTAKVITVFKVNLSTIRQRKFSGDPVICCLSSMPFKVGGVKSLAVWCSSIYDDDTPSPLTYTLRSPSPRRGIAYRGPTTSLHEAIKTILGDGRCLIVPPKMLENFPLQNESTNALQIEFFINK